MVRCGGGVQEDEHGVRSPRTDGRQNSGGMGDGIMERVRDREGEGGRRFSAALAGQHVACMLLPLCGPSPYSWRAHDAATGPRECIGEEERKVGVKVFRQARREEEGYP